MLVSLDMSMRSSGIIALEPDNTIVEQKVIITTKEDFPDHEDLMIHIREEVLKFLDNNMDYQDYTGDAFVIEGLSHGAKSGFKDVIAGIHWGIRVAIWEKFPDVLVGAVPVTSWRSKVLNKEDRKYAKENFSPQNEAIKIATVKKLPPEIHDRFHDYLIENDIHIKKMYDLADAYFLGVYRNSL